MVINGNMLRYQINFFRILYHLKTNNNEKLFKVQCW